LQALDPFPDFRGLHRFVDLIEHEPAVSDDGNIHLHVLADRRGVDVDVYHPRVGDEFRNLSGNAVVEARADRNEQVGIVHGLVGVTGTVHAEHLE